MSRDTIKRASLAQIEKMNARGKLYHDPNAPEGESLGAEFWDKADLKSPSIQAKAFAADPLRPEDQ